MFRSRRIEQKSSFDWLPWGLSVFVACCAVFVLVQGVLPERSANRQLVQRVARLETDLARATQTADDSQERAQSQLLQQNLAIQAQVNLAREQERARAALEAARRDVSQALASEIARGDVIVGEQNGELSITLSEPLLFFQAERALLKPGGRAALRELAKSMRRLPAEQVYQLSGNDEEHQRAVARFLEQVGRVPRERLVVGDASKKTPPGSAVRADEGAIQVVLLYGAR
jgi:multidrug efflux pump subunit AcrA (membrane-fusion protein)